MHNHKIALIGAGFALALSTACAGDDSATSDSEASSTTTTGEDTTTNPSTTTETTETTAGPTTTSTTDDSSSSSSSSGGIDCGGFDVCDDMCVNLNEDEANCGDCGVVCAGEQTCEGGVCSCPEGGGDDLCGDECVDFQTDVLNCGGCDNTCPPGEICVDGGCTLDCAPNEVICGEECVDTQTSNEHCGGCDMPCAGDSMCDAGVCAFTCEPNELPCDDVCTDIVENELHCGACDNACPVPDNGLPKCLAESCFVECNPGYLPNDDNTNCTNCYDAAVILDNPISYWRLGETQGFTTAFDQMSNNNGLYVDAMLEKPGASADGDTAAEFAIDGDSRVNVGPFSGMPSTEFTIEMWAKTTASGDGLFSYSLGPPPLDNEILLFNANDLRVYIGDNVLFADTNVDFNNGQWHHVVVTWRSSDGDLDVYLDGASAFNGTWMQGYSITDGGHLAIAHEQDNLNGGYQASQTFDGDLDEVAIYDFRLTPGDILNHYNAMQGNNCDGG